MDQRARKLNTVRSAHTLIVGIDVAKHSHWACIMDGRTEMMVGASFSFKNSREGFERLLAMVGKAQKKTGATGVVFGMEPTGHYWKPLAWFLKKLGQTVVTVNPYHVKRRKEFDDNSPAKNDRKDAWLVARLVQEASFFQIHLSEGVYAELRNLTHLRQQHKTRLNAVMNQVQAVLDEYFPEYYEVFTNLLGKGSTYLLTHRPFPADVLGVSKEQLSAELSGVTRARVGLKRVLKLREAAKRSIGVTEGLTASRLRLNHLLQEAQNVSHMITQAETAMAEALERTGLAKSLLSIPGIGVVVAASVLGEIGNPDRFEDWRQIRKLAGLNLADNSSGERNGGTHLSKRGRPVLRSILYMAALNLVRSNAEFRDLYYYFKTRSQNPLHSKQALMAIANKFLRIMWWLCSRQDVWDSNKALGVIRQEQLRAAA